MDYGSLALASATVPRPTAVVAQGFLCSVVMDARELVVICKRLGSWGFGVFHIILGGQRSPSLYLRGSGGSLWAPGHLTPLSLTKLTHRGLVFLWAGVCRPTFFQGRIPSLSGTWNVCKDGKFPHVSTGVFTLLNQSSFYSARVWDQ